MLEHEDNDLMLFFTIVSKNNKCFLNNPISNADTHTTAIREVV